MKSVSRKELSILAIDFLKAIARETKSELGSYPEGVQQSRWMVRTSPNEKRSRVFARKKLDVHSIGKNIQKLVIKGPTEQKILESELGKSSLQAGALNSYIMPLLNHWLKLKAPFEFEDSDVLKLLDEFADAVLDNKEIIRSRTALDDIDMASLPISLEKGIDIHQIFSEELWEFGDLEYHKSFYSINPIPSETWKILDIQLQYENPKELSAQDVIMIRDSVLITLRLLSSGSIRIIDLGSRFNYMDIGTHRSIDASRLSKGRCKRAFCLNEKRIKSLLVSWPQMREIMESDSHYLRHPAQRLFEGSERKKPEDAILDYAIGLERLLTAGIENELSYRFALRGASILSARPGDKNIYFKNLKNFYDLRSSIVHGSIRNRAPKRSLNEACSIGEDYLRRVWWWFFTNGFTDSKEGLKRGTENIDGLILSDFIREDSAEEVVINKKN
jgi:hypothetical protein